MTRLFLAAMLGLVAMPVMAHDHPAAPLIAQSDDAVTAAAIAAVDGFNAALQSGDAVLALLAENLVVLEEGGAERSRDEYAGHHLPADIVVTSDGNGAPGTFSVCSSSYDRW